MQIPSNIKSKVHDFSVTAKEFYDFMPNSTKASFVVSIAVIVHGNVGVRLMRQKYTWKQVLFSPSANLQHMKDHKVRTAVSISLAVLNLYLSKQSNKDLLAAQQSKEDKIKTLISEIAQELKVMADEYGFELDMDKLDLTVTEDDSVDGFVLTVRDDDPFEEFQTYAKELLDLFPSDEIDYDRVWSFIQLFDLGPDFPEEVTRDVYYRAYNDDITVTTDAFMYAAADVYDQQFRDSDEDEDMLTRVMVAPCGHISAIDMTDEVPGFLRSPTEVKLDELYGFTEHRLPLKAARASGDCDHFPRWGVDVNTEAANDGPSFERAQA